MTQKVRPRGSHARGRPAGKRTAGSAGPDRLPTRKKKILFLCTGNSARSQMAEALARLDHGDRLEPVSAGSYPTGWVHRYTIQAMGALGVSMEGARSKSVEEFRQTPFDIVVTVCDAAARDCPAWPNARRREHWPIEDPSFGDPATRYERFVSTRDELRRRIKELVNSLGSSAVGSEP